MNSVSTRRAFLKSAPAAIVSSAVLPAAAYAASVAPATPMEANPALVEAHGRLLVARAEQREAKDALEWLADEWRHLWPLAPEELLGGANGHIGYGRDTGERDLIGRFIHRDTSDLTKRFNPKQRRDTPRACFSVDTAEDLQQRLAGLEKSKPRGRTEKALAANTAWREETIQTFRRRVALANQYEAETARLRQAAGVSKAKARIVEAERQVSLACSEVSKIPAVNYRDLAIKGDAIMQSDIAKAMKKCDGIFADMARLVLETIDLGGGALS